MNKRNRNKVKKNSRSAGVSLWVIAAVVISVMVLIGVVFWSRSTQEVKLDRLINRIEEEFAVFEAELRPKIAALPNQHLREQLLMPFELVRINTANQSKNWHCLYRETEDEAKAAGGAASMDLGNLNYYSYNSSAETEGFAAAYAPTARQVLLNQDFDPLNPVDFLVLYHELIHSTQDTVARAGIGSEKQYQDYLAFHQTSAGHPGRLFINNEVTAYAYEIELLNIMLDGGLKSDVAAGQVDLAVYVKLLGAGADDEKTVGVLCEFAKLYYPQGLEGGDLPKEFFRFVAQSYEAKGYELYVPSQQGGGIRPMRSSDLP